jgi:hypothetical protein
VPTDAFYTPPSIAAEVARALTAHRVERVVDFAAGDGALLAAVNTRFRSATMFALDSDRTALSALRRSQPGWHLSACDFLSTRSRAASRLGRGDQHFDTVVLNPPFSFRGQRGNTLSVGAKVVRGVSPAASFVWLASAYLPPDGGQMAALIPASSMISEKDAAVWRAIDESWDVEVLRRLGRGEFPKLAAKILLVRLSRPPGRPRSRELRAMERPATFSPALAVRVVRGCTPCHKAVPSSIGRAFLHSTGLTRDGMSVTVVAATGGRETSGHAVLLPRVGAPATWKIQVRHEPAALLLSDCVLALECDDAAAAEQVAARLRNNWEQFSHVWSGSCAPYLTLRRLSTALGALGVVDKLHTLRGDIAA